MGWCKEEGCGALFMLEELPRLACRCKKIFDCRFYDKNLRATIQNRYNQNLKMWLIIVLHSSTRFPVISPISPSTRSQETVAILSNFITEETLRPVDENAGWLADTRRSESR
jgi:hypothetical protein